MKRVTVITQHTASTRSIDTKGVSGVHEIDLNGLKELELFF